MYIYRNKYLVTFIDDYSRYAWAYPLTDKATVQFGKLEEKMPKLYFYV